eukprot:scaffold26986_cov63-Phaeocystis_antarctica.AAC.2
MAGLYRRAAAVDRSTWRACASSEARSAGQSSCTRQAAESLGCISACSSSTAGPRATRALDARTHVFTMGDRRFRRAALPALSAFPLKALSSCSSCCRPAASASVGTATDSSSMATCSRSGDIKWDERMSVMADCLTLAVPSFSHSRSARALSARILFLCTSTLPSSSSTVCMKTRASVASLTIQTSRASSTLASTPSGLPSSSPLSPSLLTLSSSSSAAAPASATALRRASACQASCRAPEEGRSGSWWGATVAPLSVASLRVAPVKSAPLSLGVGQVGWPGGVAHFDDTGTPTVDRPGIIVLAALGEHGQVGTSEVCGPVLLECLRLARRALWEDGQVRAGELRPTEHSPLQLRKLEAGPLELRPTEVGPLQPRLTELGPLQPRPTEVGPLELRHTEESPLEMRPHEVGSLELRLIEAHLLQLRPTGGSPLQLLPTERSPLQLRPSEHSTLQLRRLEVHAAQDRILQIKRAVGATQPLDVSRFPATQIKPHHRQTELILCRLDGALRLLRLSRRALAHAYLAHAVHRAHDHRVRPVRVV